MRCAQQQAKADAGGSLSFLLTFGLLLSHLNQHNNANPYQKKSRARILNFILTNIQWGMWARLGFRDFFRAAVGDLLYSVPEREK